VAVHPARSPSSSALIRVRGAQRCCISTSPRAPNVENNFDARVEFPREPNAAVQRDDDASQFEISHFLYITSLLA
jgi:hypothetical protein